MMELRRLRLLHEFARLGTVAAVAQSLSYSPSSVSVQLAELEREAGIALLRHVGRNVVLTPAGQRLAEHAGQALRADEAVRAELAQLGEAPRGRLRMTFVQTPALALLPGTLDRLSELAPGLNVEIVQRETAPALEELRAGLVDLVVGIEYEPLPVGRHRDVDRVDLLLEDVLVAVHPGHAALPTRGPIRLTALEHEVWASGQPGTGLDAVMRNVCNRLGGYEPDIRHRTDDGLLLSALVRSGRAVTLLPALLTASMPALVARRVREENLQRRIFSAARHGMRDAPSIRAVRQALADTATKTAAANRNVLVA